jgi:hypothetical protein
MAFIIAPLLCPFIVVSDIFALKKNIAKTHCKNAGFNVPDNAPLSIYKAALAGHWLVMGLKIDNSSVDVRLSKVEVAIENIVFLAAPGNLAVN